MSCCSHIGSPYRICTDALRVRAGCTAIILKGNKIGGADECCPRWIPACKAGAFADSLRPQNQMHFAFTVAFAIPPHLAKLCKMAGFEPARAVLNCSHSINCCQHLWYLWSGFPPNTFRFLFLHLLFTGLRHLIIYP